MACHSPLLPGPQGEDTAWGVRGAGSTPSLVTDVLWTHLTGLWTPGKVTVSAPPTRHSASQIGTAVLLIGLDNLFEDLQDIWSCPIREP